MDNALLRPLQIKHVTIRNRVLSTAHAPMYARDGRPTNRYIQYQTELAKGGIGLTIVGGATSVAVDSWASFWSTLSVMDDSSIPDLRRLSAAIHAHGTVAMIQLTHIGRKLRWDASPWLPPISASTVREPHHRSFPKSAEDWDLRRIVRAYADGVRRSRDGGLDGVEVLCSQQHLVDQFWSPATNHRIDEYGGSFENRMRLGREILESARAEVGSDFLLGIRMSGDERLEKGLSKTDLLEIARYYASTGLIDFIDVAAGNVETISGLAHAIPGMAEPTAPFLSDAARIRRAVDVKVFHAGGITDLKTAARAIDEGHVDMIGMTRAHIADPHIIRKLMQGNEDRIRPCVRANYCIDRIYAGGDSLCIHNAARGREMTLPHVFAKSSARKAVVIVGGGPAGLEAARVSAERGHAVVLFEAANWLGGQVNLAARAPGRETLHSIIQWLEHEVRQLNVDLRLQQRATAQSVQELRPDLVIVASGGRPNTGDFTGHELAFSSWDVLAGKLQRPGRVLFFDDNGQQQGLSVVDYLIQSGAKVELVTPDREIGAEIGITNLPRYLRNIYTAGVQLTPDRRLKKLVRKGSTLEVVLSSEFDGPDEIREVDAVVCEHGTVPNDDLYFTLRPQSNNYGDCDLVALALNDRVTPIRHNCEGQYILYRIGDALGSRNIHAAMYDALRLCHDF